MIVTVPFPQDENIFPNTFDCLEKLSRHAEHPATESLAAQIILTRRDDTQQYSTVKSFQRKKKPTQNTERIVSANWEVSVSGVYETGKHIPGKREFLSSVISLIICTKKYICKFESAIPICFLNIYFTFLKKAVKNQLTNCLYGLLNTKLSNTNVSTIQIKYGRHMEFKIFLRAT